MPFEIDGQILFFLITIVLAAIYQIYKNITHKRERLRSDDSLDNDNEPALFTDSPAWDASPDLQPSSGIEVVFKDISPKAPHPHAAETKPLSSQKIPKTPSSSMSKKDVSVGASSHVRLPPSRSSSTQSVRLMGGYKGHVSWKQAIYLREILGPCKALQSPKDGDYKTDAYF